MTREEAIARIKDHMIVHKMNEQRAIYISEALGMAIKALEQQPCEDAISRADVEQTVEDNILCYTHSDRPIDQDPDTECDMAIRMALRMLRKDLRKLPSAQPNIIQCRNCKFASGDSRICMKFGHSPIGELDFCAWAERRTDE